jgi:predicted patatin/cPLA2 family phospholipase
MADKEEDKSLGTWRDVWSRITKKKKEDDDYSIVYSFPAEKAKTKKKKNALKELYDISSSE